MITNSNINFILIHPDPLQIGGGLLARLAWKRFWLECGHLFLPRFPSLVAITKFIQKLRKSENLDEHRFLYRDSK